MALTYTPIGSIGNPCPPFQLPSVDGKVFSLKDFAQAKAMVVMFLCGHCPYVQAIEERIVRLAKDFSPLGVSFVAICSNDARDYPEDRPEALLQRWRAYDYGFPYLIDEPQDTAKAFGAVCTPDIFLFDSSHKLRYRGRFDDSWRDSKLVKKQELKMALESVLQKLPVSEVQNPSMGCSIKWKKDD